MKRVVGALLAGAVVLAAIPYLHLAAFYESFLYLIFLWVVLATSWNILSGYSGYVSFGHGAFFGVGVYTTAALATKFGWPFLATLPFAALTAALLGVALGAVVFRVKQVRAELFALLTLAVTFIVATIVLNTPIDGGPGLYLSAVPVPTLGPGAASSFFFLGLVAAVFAVLVAYGIYISKLGSGLFAIHDDEDAAEVLGVPTYRYKLFALAISCALAGVAGGIHALFVSYVTVAETFSITVPLTVVLMSVLGGTRHWAGPALGAAIITTLTYASTAGDYILAGRAAVGLILIIIILFRPEGLLGGLSRRLPPLVPAGSQIEPSGGVAAAMRASNAATSESRIASGKGTGSTLLAVRALSKAFRGVQALDGVDLGVQLGEILGLLGPNGSGKSTLINVVSGHYRADAGSIIFDGERIVRRDAHRIARLGIARTYQIPRPFAHRSVLENVMLPAMFGAAALDRRGAEREALRWLEFTDLADRTQTLPAALNLHQRKFLELARALASRPRLLLLDEVLSGLTPVEIDGAVRLIRRIREQGTTIVLVEHVMRIVVALADRLVVLDQGRVIAEGLPGDVMAHPAVITAYLGSKGDAAG
ncbi:MAG: branched-chain amino acid ABC transporter ATP-binding protein/permease [Pseudomonadota bacterium]|nr:branched-chain amino acid ABC transporter ATP-binding protein/permease [Pseudomonadota bacterium]